jgi:hypothetical protein
MDYRERIVFSSNFRSTYNIPLGVEIGKFLTSRFLDATKVFFHFETD